MHQMFPMMIDRPSKRAMVSGITYWMFAFLFIPCILTLGVIFSYAPTYELEMEIAYHIVNFVVSLLIFWRYMKANFLNVQIEVKKVCSTIGLCAVVIVILRAGLLQIFTLAGNTELAGILFHYLPTVEMDLFLTPAMLLQQQPVFGAICIVILAPVSISCLLYGCVFAQVCVDHQPWQAYLATTAMFLLQHVAMILAYHSAQEHLTLFALALPVHLIACWSYQKTDTIWTPIGVHMLANLAFTLVYFKGLGIF